MNAVLAKSVEFSNSSAATVIRANARGQKVVALGTALDGLMQEIVLSTAAAKAAGVSETSPVEKKAQALRGKKISIDAKKLKVSPEVVGPTVAVAVGLAMRRAGDR